MLLLQKVFILLFFLTAVRVDCINLGINTISESPTYCTTEDFNQTLCKAAGEVMGSLSPVHTILFEASQYLGPFTGMVRYGGQIFQKDHYNVTTIESTAHLFDVYIITATSGPIHMTFTEFMLTCTDTLKATSKVALALHGYSDNCTSPDLSKIRLQISVEKWQDFAAKMNVTVIFLDLTAKGFFCYSYFALVACYGTFIPRFLSYVLRIKCQIKGAQLILIGYSLGAQYVAALARDMKENGEKVAFLFLADPAGPLFGPLGKCSDCIGIVVIVIHTNPGLLGTAIICKGGTHILVNVIYLYRQPNGWTPSDWHGYSLYILEIMIQGDTLNGTLVTCSEYLGVNDFSGPTVSFSIYDPPPKGCIAIKTYNGEGIEQIPQAVNLFIKETEQYLNNTIDPILKVASLL